MAKFVDYVQVPQSADERISELVLAGNLDGAMALLRTVAGPIPPPEPTLAERQIRIHLPDPWVVTDREPERERIARVIHKLLWERYGHLAPRPPCLDASLQMADEIMDGADGFWAPRQTAFSQRTDDDDAGPIACAQRIIERAYNCGELEIEAKIVARAFLGVPRDERGLDAYQIIADCNRQSMLRRAGIGDRSREPLLGPPTDMAISRVLLAERADMDPKEADRLAVKIADALLAQQASMGGSKLKAQPSIPEIIAQLPASKREYFSPILERAVEAARAAKQTGEG